MSTTQVIESWASIGINVNPNATNVKALCPSCTASRKNKRDKSLSVSPVNGVANCHNCGATFVIKSDRGYQAKEYTKPDVKQRPYGLGVKQFFEERGIEERVLEYFKIAESKEWMYEKGEYKQGEVTCINFNYFQDRELVNVKFRDRAKRFRMVTGAKLIFYNQDAIVNSDWCAIVEGEIDCMSAYQVGVFPVVSVPNGASKGNQRLEYLDNSFHLFDNKKKIIIATDDDQAGNELRDELIRRLGRDRCYIVRFPDGCKDSNEVLMQKDGAALLKSMFDNADPLPLEGILDGALLTEGVMKFYENGFPRGLRIGYSDFDRHLTFRGGELTVVTGIPGSGKSEFIDQVMVRLASRYGWRSAIFSPEHQPSTLHAMALTTKFLGEKTIGKEQVTRMKMERGIDFIQDHFFFMKVDEIDITIDGILDLARELVIKKGIKILLIDPYNYIEHNVPKGYSETQYISELLTKLCNFLRLYDVHGFLIAHPTKIQKDKKTGEYQAPTLYDIAGSAHFFNKAYNGLSVYRDFNTNEVTVHIQKVKFKFIGKLGSCSFNYDYGTGRYKEPLSPIYENEFQLMLSAQSQPEIAFDEPDPRPAGQLTDITKLTVNSESFDYKPTDSAPF